MSKPGPMTPRGHAYLRAAEALRKIPGDWTVLYELLFELAVMEGARAEGRPSPREAEFRKAYAVEVIKHRVPPEVVRILGS